MNTSPWPALCMALASLMCLSGCAGMKCPPFEASWTPGEARLSEPSGARDTKLWLLHHGSHAVRLTSVLLDGVQQLRKDEVLELLPGQLHERTVQTDGDPGGATCRLPVSLVLECKGARFSQSIEFPNIMSPDMVREWLAVPCGGKQA